MVSPKRFQVRLTQSRLEDDYEHKLQSSRKRTTNKKDSQIMIMIKMIMAIIRTLVGKKSGPKKITINFQKIVSANLILKN